MSRSEKTKNLRDTFGAPLYGDASRGVFESVAWVTPLIVGVNIAVFGAMAMMFNSVIGFTPAELALWGANSGALDLSGQWWRLVTYQFLHANIFHIGINMWVMWTVGRLTERLFGSFVLLFLYLGSGALAGLASIVWNPDQVSVGASGSIFAVIGAFLAILFRERDEIPISVLQYWLPLLLFVAFNFVSGSYQPGVDNACHVGGVLSGLCLGAILARPLENRGGFPLARVFLSAIFGCAGAVAPLVYLDAFNHKENALEEFSRTHQWYQEREASDLQLWQALAAQAGSGTISNDELASKFESQVLPFWEDAHNRLNAELKSSKNEFLPLVADFADKRLAWAQAVIAVLRKNDTQRAQTAVYLGQQTNLAQARIDRAKLRVQADTLPQPLAENWLVGAMLEKILGHEWRCVDPPEQLREVAVATDARDDGPAERHATGCLAQHMFMTRDYASLDALMQKYSGDLSDLPDGGSHLSGILNGLNDLFAYGEITLDGAMRRTSEWRRSVKGSVEPELVEVQLFRDWAYAARGNGYASTVTPQAFESFSYRTEMAATGLRETAASATNNPLWYQLSLEVGRDQSVSIEKLRATFDEGSARFPKYMPLYTQMLVVLMPRWSGSIDLVDDFIVGVSKKAGGFDQALYAELYLIYGELEGGNYTVVGSAKANLDTMNAGIEKLRQRYPKSDYILNMAARFECLNNDSAAYRAIRPLLTNHVSSTAWPSGISLAMCDEGNS